MKTEIKLITPQIAEEMLKHNIGNRNVHQPTVDYYKTLMLQGQWKENGDSIVFSQSGRLIDGQHRLLAIIASGCSYHYCIISDVDDEVFYTIDDGRGRKDSDVFGIMKIENASGVSSIVRGTLNLANGVTGHAIGGVSSASLKAKMNKDKMLEEYGRHPDIYQRAYRMGSRGRDKLNILTIKEVGSIYAYLVIYRLRPAEKVEKFFNSLFFGGNESKVLVALRDRLYRDRLSRTSHMPYSYKLRLIARAWNLWLAGKDTKNLKVGDDTDVTFN